jgi:hypothetical protein
LQRGVHGPGNREDALGNAPRPRSFRAQASPPGAGINPSLPPDSGLNTARARASAADLKFLQRLPQAGQELQIEKRH